MAAAIAFWIPLAALPISAAVMAYLVLVRNYTKQSFMYLLYARTPLGRYLHQSALAKHRTSLNSMAAKQDGGLKRLSQPEYNHHSKSALVRIVPFLSDNYAYILLCKATKTAAVVDPADPQAVFQELSNLEHDIGGSITVKTILTTHYHSDHAGGNKEFAELITAKGGNKVEIVGGANERYPGVQGATRQVNHGEDIQVGKLNVRVLNVPCHTWGSVLFLCEDICFTGDYLFSAGCGRFFEGGAKNFCDSLALSVNPLPDSVCLFCGHEYTVSNLRFAQKVLPDDPYINDRMKEASELREQGLPTIPSLLGDERKYNVFIRAGDPRLTDHVLVERTKALVEQASPLFVSSGEDKHDGSLAKVVLGPAPDSVALARALRALKDRS